MNLKVYPAAALSQKVTVFCPLSDNEVPLKVSSSIRALQEASDPVIEDRLLVHEIQCL